MRRTRVQRPRDDTQAEAAMTSVEMMLKLTTKLSTDNDDVAIRAL